MPTLSELLQVQPLLPFIREGDMAERKPWRFPERRLLDYLLIFVMKGRCRFWVEKEPHDFEEGEFCLIQPGCLTVLEGLTDTMTPFLHLDFFYSSYREQSFPTKPGQVNLAPYKEYLQPSLNELAGIQVPVRLKPKNPLKFREQFLRLVGGWHKRDPLNQLQMQQEAAELVMSILADHNSLEPAQGDYAGTLDWIPSYFSLNLSENLTIKDMAQKASLSPSRFSAVFKEKYRQAPHQYLLEMRIQHAIELLQTSMLSQEEIAEYCGFADIHHFSKAFKKRTGQPPGKYRV
ncbi:AraC family transcriptional regulator [Metabacillus sp. GX 13764]|uniref:helix-turn-helix domain-containing protein n=1 Tax=Metabacillus kandeliae TaxID=2900151 RepID=UPI001E29BCE2|nr:AraC family transcriptional regulator [Metabacillus kandeliae]MCD7034616.1 AraC family transcriptional regulator [Metabacillus kandeliae]